MNISDFSPYQQYYIDGFHEGEFNINKDLNDLKGALYSILEEDLKDGFRLDQKFPGTKDLRPNAYSYSKSFINILFSNNIPELIKSLTGKNLTLSHVQVRTSSLEESYMPWHRDSFVKDHEYIGPCPPVHKIIFYPMVGSERPKLCIGKGSQLCTFRNQLSKYFIQDGYTNMDQQIMNGTEQKRYYSSFNKFILFNTGMLHGTVPEIENEKSIRIIYSFVEEFQFEELYSKKKLHSDLNDICI